MPPEGVYPVTERKNIPGIVRCPYRFDSHSADTFH